jgi:hypothetical protein
MRRSSHLLMRIVLVGLALWSLYCLYCAGDRLWTFLRMRNIPVEVVRSSLVIDAPIYTAGQPAEPQYSLRLDLLTTDGSKRAIKWNDIHGKAVYPEEDYDELAKWSLGSRHTISQLRGEAREIRLAGTQDSPERNAAGYYLAGAIFIAFLMYLALALMESQGDPWVPHSLLSIRGGLKTIAAISTVCAVLYAAWYIPKIMTWPAVTATVQSAPESYDPATLPPNVTITPAGRKRLESSRHRVITFQWNGTTIHGGIGSMEGRYDELAGSASTLKFWINPEDRWDVAARLGWNAGLFVPAGFFLIVAAAFFAAGRRS